LLAVRNELLSPQALAAATAECHGGRSLGDVLLARGHLRDTELALLRRLVDSYLERHIVSPTAGTLPAAGPAIPQTLMPIAQQLAATRSEAGAASRYRVLRPHKKGGLGEVFVALDEELKREVALKEIQARHADNPESRQRFLLEAEVTGRLEHPGIVPVYGLGAYPDGRPYYAMRFIKGDSLLHALQRFHADESLENDPGKRTLELRQLLRRFQDVCNAVAYAHSKGVLHRDLKPDNVMLGNYGETLVVDWGLAKAQFSREPLASAEPTGSLTLRLSGPDSGLTQAGHVLGTPQYMSPEQASGQNAELTPASDVYSLGATLYHLLTGRAPFVGGNAYAILEGVCRGQFPPPRQLDATIPAALEAICLKAMALRLAERYASAKELSDEVEHWLADEPVAAYPEPLRLRLARWRRRHPALVTGAAALVFTTLVALGVGALLLSQEQGRTLKEQQAKLAEQEKAKRALDERALAQVNALLDASPQAVPAILRGLDDYREQIRPRLAEVRARPEPSQGREAARRLWRQHRARVALALLPEAAVREELVRWLVQAEDPAEVLLVREELAAHGKELAPGLWRTVDDPKVKSAARFRALVALARLDPNNRRWATAGSAAVEELLSANPLHLGAWVQALRPVRAALLGSLAEVFRGRRLVEFRQVATTVLADWAADRPELLGDLLLDADPKQDALLFPLLRRHRERAVVLFHAELDKGARFDWKDSPLAPAWKVPDTAVVRRIEAAQGTVAERFALCQALPLKQFDALAESLAKAGYRPVRLRPYAAANGPLGAAVWTRDGEAWRAVHGRSAADVRRQDVEQRKAGYQPVDVAGYLDGKEERYAALWVKGDKAEETRLYVGVSELRHRPDGWGPMRAAKLQPATLQVLIGAEGEARYSSVWRKGGPEGIALWNDDEKTHADRGLGDGLPVDVCLYANLQAIDNVRAELGAWLMGSPWPGLSWRHRNLLWPHPERRYGGCFAKSTAFDYVLVFGRTPEQQLRRGRELAAQGYRPAAMCLASRLASRGRQPSDSTIAASLWHRPVIAEDIKERLAKRQANAAVALLRLGRPERVWPLFQHRPDPRVRSYLIHRLSPLGMSAGAMVKRLQEEPEESARRALLLCLGEFSTEQLPQAERQALIPTLLRLYRNDPDPGLHGAADWLLRRWGQADQLRALDKQLASRGRKPPDDRRWYVNGQGQTMVLVPGPVEFLMGTPRTEAGREGGPEGKFEKQHRRRIGRNFAIAAREVTVAEFLRFRADHDYGKTYSPTPAHPINCVSWYQAAEYCNWLSKQEGIPEDQWCYLPNDKGEYAEGMRMKPNWLSLTGYRLPTEAEWEYACRAGAMTSRYYGETEELLGQYAWYTKTSLDKNMLPAGDRPKPNDLGLFDMLGNALEWCQDGIYYYPDIQYGQSGYYLQARKDISHIGDRLSRVLRGGSFGNQAGHVRSGNRFVLAPAIRLIYFGFRPARTLP
jgi:formylglycine-generating enzyme required for sulfatase activity/tRNA A-37 threonylcarbamoyl transferase component Bud32